MSRTFRRRGYEDTQRSSWDREGGKIAGYYTEYDSEYVTSGRYWKCIYTYREPTKAEFIKKYWRIHGESSSNCSYGPAHWHRSRRMKQNRMINKQELHNWFKNEYYEPLFEANPRNCWWDWD